MSRVLRNKLQFHLDAASALMEELRLTRWAEELPVCEKCFELDQQIERCERLVAQVTDQPTAQAIAEILKKHLADKDALHPVVRE